MHKVFLAALMALIVSPICFSNEVITKKLVEEVINITDKASIEKNADVIAKHLSSEFNKVIEISSGGQLTVTVPLNKNQYIEMITEGWKKIENYSYIRDDVTIEILNEGTAAKSNSTLIEKFAVDGKDVVSKIREYAYYATEDGHIVITKIESITLVGDTTHTTQ